MPKKRSSKKMVAKPQHNHPASNTERPIKRRRMEFSVPSSRGDSPVAAAGVRSSNNKVSNVCKAVNGSSVEDRRSTNYNTNYNVNIWPSTTNVETPQQSLAEDPMITIRNVVQSFEHATKELQKLANLQFGMGHIQDLGQIDKENLKAHTSAPHPPAFHAAQRRRALSEAASSSHRHNCPHANDDTVQDSA